MQIFIFLTCAGVGALSGIVYDLLYIARCAVCGVKKQAYTAKDRVFIIACDVLYFAVLSAAFVFTSVMFDFYEIRFFMLAGCILGVILYLKSFHVIVAFFAEKVYNKITLKKANKGKLYDAGKT